MSTYSIQDKTNAKYLNKYKKSTENLISTLYMITLNSTLINRAEQKLLTKIKIVVGTSENVVDLQFSVDRKPISASDLMDSMQKDNTLCNNLHLKLIHLDFSYVK